MHFSEYRELSRLAAYTSGWTQRVLTDENREWLSRLPQGPVRPIPRKVMCVHGSPWNEDAYTFFRDDALAAFRSCRARIIFCGHTHWQVGWSWNGTELTPLKPELEPNAGASENQLRLSDRNRYVLNPGSVGQPRDGDGAQHSLFMTIRRRYSLGTASLTKSEPRKGELQGGTLLKPSRLARPIWNGSLLR